jgi:hypothetical protein
MKAQKNILSRRAQSGDHSDVTGDEESLTNTSKSFWDRIWPVMACGAGLFSDGCGCFPSNTTAALAGSLHRVLADINNVIGSVSTILTRLYGKAYTGSNARKNVSAITFAGTVLGQLVFGYTSDRYVA